MDKPTITSYLEDDEDPASRVFVLRMGLKDMEALVMAIGETGFRSPLLSGDGYQMLKEELKNAQQNA